MFLKFRKLEIPRWLLRSAIIFFINLSLLGLTYFSFSEYYEDKIFPGIFAGKTSLGGKSKLQAISLLQEKIDRIKSDSLTFAFGQERASVPLIIQASPELSYEVITFDPEKTAAEAFQSGRTGNFFTDLRERMAFLIYHKRLPVSLQANETRIYEILKNNFSDLENPGQDAALIFANSGLSSISKKKFEITQEKSGESIDYATGISNMVLNLSQLENPIVWLKSEKTTPLITTRESLNIEQKASQALELAPLALSHDGQEWRIDKDLFATWLRLGINPDYRENDDLNRKIVIILDLEKVKKYLSETVAPKINKVPVNAKFRILNGKLAQFQTSSDGLELDIEKSSASINSEFFYGGKKEIVLSTSIVQSDITLDEVNDFGLKEIIGTGESNFSGSPANRRHNIKVGADSVNGVLVAPGEEFSLLSALGRIDGSTGYLPELVIKDNKTTPEFGGGLCQVGTTMFRAALASGFPITQRRNHSYRVSYYEPAGTDATIYDPWPDFRFLNDTANHILVQSRIAGNNLYFDIWGTKDGRKVEKTKPVIYNIVKPAPTRIIETLSLAPGEKKCTEKAHNGADAYFDYKVTYPNEEVKEKRFLSHYVPWQEVCLLGVKELTAASSSPASISATTSADIAR